ncbi:MAG: hypothetical protein U1F81_13045 [Verrucomicrobiaceae bacterium]
MNTDSKLKHLEFIQNVITRMGNNSFLIKGWSVTLVAALFALADKDTDQSYSAVVYLPVFAFWWLDGYFLSQERQYRALFNDVAAKSDDQVDFSMDASSYNKGYRSWFRTAFSKTVFSFHGVLLTAIVIVMFVIPRLKCGGACL